MTAVKGPPLKILPQPRKSKMMWVLSVVWEPGTASLDHFQQKPMLKHSHAVIEIQVNIDLEDNGTKD